MKKIKNGFFITFEGAEGVGKSTQTKLLKSYLESQGYNVLLTREPGGTDVGDKLAEIVKYFNGKEKITDEAELFMFSASRAMIVDAVIKPFLNDGGIVICDRFYDSTAAYQGYGRGISLEIIETLKEIAVKGCYPDLTILLEANLEKAMGRAQKETQKLGKEDRMENEKMTFHQKVKEGFSKIASENPERVARINADGTIEDINKVILSKVEDAISKVQ